MIRLYIVSSSVRLSSFMFKCALDALNLKIYENVYCNVYSSKPGLIYFDDHSIILEDLRDSLILLDESFISVNSCSAVDLSVSPVSAFLDKLHPSVDVSLFVKRYDLFDKDLFGFVNCVHFINKGPFGRESVEVF